jgi:predicted nucleic acid-binding protein
MGSKYLIDTNIWIDMLNSLPEAAAALKALDDAAISAITYMEVASGSAPADKATFDLMLDGTVPILHTDDQITQLATAFNQDPNTWRGRGNTHLPDSIIGATAVVSNRILVTRNPNDFKIKEGPVRKHGAFVFMPALALAGN